MRRPVRPLPTLSVSSRWKTDETSAASCGVDDEAANLAVFAGAKVLAVNPADMPNGAASAAMGRPGSDNSFKGAAEPEGTHHVADCTTSATPVNVHTVQPDGPATTAAA